MLGSLCLRVVNLSNPLLWSICIAVLSQIGAAIFVHDARSMYFCFMGFETALGIFSPTIAAYKAKVVHPGMRGLVYNLFRVPTNAIVSVSVLLSMDVFDSFMLTSVLLSLAFLAERTLMYEKSKHLKQTEL